MYFQQKLELETAGERLFCKLFSFSLMGLSLTWFRNLRNGSIDSFSTLYNKFIGQYSSNQREDKGPDSLLSLKQQPRERMQSFKAILGSYVGINR